jgi:hypothetical protein
VLSISEAEFNKNLRSGVIHIWSEVPRKHQNTKTPKHKNTKTPMVIPAPKKSHYKFPCPIWKRPFLIYLCALSKKGCFNRVRQKMPVGTSLEFI